MKQKLNCKETVKKLHQLENEAARYKKELMRARDDRKELALFLSRVPLFMMVVDQERRVRKVSDSILQFTGQKMEDIFGLRGGEALRWVKLKKPWNGKKCWPGRSITASKMTCPSFRVCCHYKAVSAKMKKRLRY